MRSHRAPIWQRWWSYISDVHIESRSSEYSDGLHVVLSRGRYQLLTDEAVYSYEDLYANFGILFTDHLTIPNSAKKVLVLGLGLASIPILLDQQRPGEWEITAVEIDEEVCDLAHIYGYPRVSSDIETIVADAAIYPHVCHDSYDMICVDIFVGDRTPDDFTTAEYLESLKRILNPDGLIIYNTLAYTEEQRQTSDDFFLSTFRDVYPTAQSIYAHRNNMLISHGHWLS